MTGQVIMTIESDIWSFAMTALELFTRKIPFEECKNWLGVTRRILAGLPDYPSDELTCHRMTGIGGAYFWNAGRKIHHRDLPSGKY